MMDERYDTMDTTMDQACESADGYDQAIRHRATCSYDEVDEQDDLYALCGYDPSDPEAPTPAEVEAELAQRQWDELERDRLAEEAEEEEFVEAVWLTFHCQAG